MLKTIYYKLRAETMFMNSFYLMASNIFLAGTGFAFWIVVARFYSSTDVGLATTIFSLMSMITSFGLVGLNTGLMRYLPKSEFKNEKISSSINLVILSTLALSILAILFLEQISPKILFLKTNFFYASSFIIFNLFGGVSSIIESAFIALRIAKYVFIKNIIMGLVKFALPIFFITLGAYGIFIAISLGMVATVLYSIYILFFKYKYRYEASMHVDSIKTMAFFSVGTFIASLASNFPSYILPIFITNNLSPSSTAYYYMAATIANLIFMIPAVVAQNLLVEGAHDQKNLKLHILKAGKIIAAVLIPTIIGIMLFGNYILLVFGKNYSSEGIGLLRLLSISGFIVAINYVFSTILTLQNRIRTVIIISSLSSLTLIGLSYEFLHMGLMGIGLATILAQICLVGMYSIVFAFKRSF